MVVNFRACEISRGVRNLTLTPTLIKKIININFDQIIDLNSNFSGDYIVSVL
jgi:hypothetical protein